MKYEPFAKSLIATSLALSCLMAHAASVAPVAAENGMVVTAQHLATHVGVDVLKSGGNAVDAAVAVGYALAVVYPAAGNLGGGGFMTMQLADGRKTFLDFREKAPLAATAEHVPRQGRQRHPGPEHARPPGRGVPGTVSGMELALSKYGTKPRRNDRPGDQTGGRRLRAGAGRRRHAGLRDRRFRRTCGFRRDLPAQRRADAGRAEAGAERPGAHPAAISDKGADGFYKGWVADAIVTSSQAGGASSPRPTSTNTRPANWPRSSATTVATTWSRRRRRAPAAW
jgi:gamma-glutamyltranspeptidase/glutathione hydrolase